MNPDEHCVIWVAGPVTTAYAKSIAAYSLRCPHNPKCENSLCCACGWEFKGPLGFVDTVDAIAYKHLEDSV